MTQTRSIFDPERSALGRAPRIAIVAGLSLLGLAVAAPAGALADGPADLLSAANVRLDGQLATDLAGSSVAAAGDPNDDGIDDVIIGAPSANNNSRADSGSAYVVYGRATPGAVDLASLGTAGFRIDGQVASDNAGASVAAAGDVNADGIDDVIVGAPGAGNNGRGFSGSAYVVYGQDALADPPDLDLASLGSAGFRIDGQASSNFAGSSVAAAGDVNDDGIDDVIVGARFAANNGRNFSGSSYVVYGQDAVADPPDLDLASPGSPGFFRIDGQASNNLSGTSVAAAGDPNDDGIDDVIVGAPEAGNNGSSSGSAYVVYGQPVSDPADVDLLALGALGFRIDGNSNNQAGRSVAAAGDPNDDGIDDVIVGAPNASSINGSVSGSAYVVYGQTTILADPDDLVVSSLGARGFRIDGEGSSNFAGTSVAAAGDPNGDGIDDVIVGAPGANSNGRSLSGSAYVVYGESRADPFDLSLVALGTRGLRIDGAAENEFAGGSVAAAGDPNADGIDDVIVGAQLADNNGRADSGSAYVLGAVPSSAPGALAFGSVGSPVPQGTLSAPQTVTVTNNELAPVSIDGFVFSGANAGDFVVTADTCHRELEAVSTCTASIRFAPQAQGTRTATLSVQIDGLADPLTALSGIAGPLPQGPAGATGGQGSTGQGTPGPQGATGQTGAQGTQGPPGRDALVTCKVKTKNGKPKVKCTVTFPAAGARRVKLELVRKGTVYARGATRSGGSVTLEPRGELRAARYTLRIVTLDGEGQRSLTESRIGL